MTAGIFKCAEGATEELSLEARQRLGLVHAGLGPIEGSLTPDATKLDLLLKQGKFAPNQ